MFGRQRTPLVGLHPSLLMFHIECHLALISSSLVLYWVHRSGSFNLAKRSYSHGLILGEYGGYSNISHCQQLKRSMTAAVVFLLALSWRMMEFYTTKCRCFLLSPFNYVLFAKVKESMQGTWYNTRDEPNRAIGWSIQNINKDRHADGIHQGSSTRGPRASFVRPGKLESLDTIWLKEK